MSAPKISKSKKGVKFMVQMLVWAFIVAFFAYFSYQNIIKLYQVKANAASIQKQIDAETAHTADIQKEMEYQESDAFIEKVAREQLGLVKPDEIVFVVR